MAESTWDEREGLILEALFAAEESGVDVNDATRSAVPGLDGQTYMRVVAGLVEGGYIDGDVRRLANGSIGMVMIRALRADGRRRIGQWPSPNTGSSVTERWGDLQTELLRAGSTAEVAGEDVNDAAVAAAPNLTEQEFAVLARDLLDQGLVRGSVMNLGEETDRFRVHITGVTPAGRDRIRNTRAGAREDVIDESEHGRVEAFSTLIRRAEESGELDDLSEDDRADLDAQTETLESQLRSPTPRRSVIISTLKVAAGILAGAASLVLGQECLNLIHLLS